MCNRWRDSFQNFLKDMGEPKPNESINRIDNDGNYCPENCRWATTREQANNMRTNTVLECRGEQKTLAEWERETGIKRQTITTRIKRNGWSVEKALTTIPRGKRTVFISHCASWQMPLALQRLVWLTSFSVETV